VRAPHGRMLDDPPLAVYLIDAPDLSGYGIAAGVSRGGVVTVLLRRARRTQWFVLSLLLIPLLLIVVVARLARRSSGARTDIAIGAGAVLLALLPIRAALVPANIGSLTLVDYILGVEVALLTLVIVWHETSD